MELYALSIKGVMLYFVGNIDKSLYNDIDNVAKKIELFDYDPDFIKYSKIFTSQIFNLFHIKLKRVDVSYVFRK